jgi:large subunit ribosomal protein L25
MAQIIVEGAPRETRGKNEARRMRVAGKVPATLYGGKGKAISLAVNTKQVTAILRSESGHNTLFQVDLGGQHEPVIVKDWQVDPVSGRLLHVDLIRVAMDVRMRVKVPVHTFGEPSGVKVQGGVFELVTREVEVECLPSDIPTEFKVDVSGLALNQSLRAGDLPLDKAKLKLLSDRNCSRGCAARRGREACRSSGWPDDSGRARSHQEGQEGNGRRGRRRSWRKAREDGKEEVILFRQPRTPRHAAHCWPWQSWPGISVVAA